MANHIKEIATARFLQLFIAYEVSRDFEKDVTLIIKLSQLIYEK